VVVYAVTIFVSAFLLFQVQPVIAKMILPWFGGSAAVWTTCLLFFQVGLLLGYLYAYWSTQHLQPRVQAVLHVGLLALSLLALPILPSQAWKPLGSEDPVLRILGLLAATIGLPYFLLSTTGPLVQAWYARQYKGSLPYRLYALSNLGSMLGLLTYPVLVEPVSTTRTQGLGWSVGYVIFALLCGRAALRTRGARQLRGVAPPEDVERPGWSLHLLWIGLPACASILLLAVTNHLSQNVAAIPFLWVLPLSLYLLSFILCFEGSGWYRRNPFLQLLAVALGGMAYGIGEDHLDMDVKALIPLFSAGLFICCMVCHGELARLKPHSRYLTSFYLMLSLGGAIGGVFVGLLAPHLFRGYFELPIGLAACAVLVLVVLGMERRNVAWFAGVALAAAMVVYFCIEARKTTAEARVMVRNFYGGLRVIDESSGDPGATRKLMHGTINHGEQFLSPALRERPTTYYGPQSGVALAIREAAAGLSERVGVIGLGTGTLASYGRPGDYYRFYEINPLVIRLANTEFTFLRGSKARVDVALGDARLSLEREPAQNFDVLAVDAFSGDSIPVHLLTEEAFALYSRHLKAGGVVAVHVSNKYLDLKPVVQRVAAALGNQARLVDTDDDEDDVFGATWILVSGRRDFFEKPPIRDASTALEGQKRLRAWTDDYSNLFQILK
jgi:SAM-dependent methyltransferase